MNTFKQYNTQYGYKLYKVRNKSQFTHQLILIAFLTNLIRLMHNVVDHIDENPSNNHISNLRWYSQCKNNLIRLITKGYTYDKERGTYRPKIKIHEITYNFSRCKNTEEQENFILKPEK